MSKNVKYNGLVLTPNSEAYCLWDKKEFKELDKHLKELDNKNRELEKRYDSRK